jgi:hypothetical protein
MKWLGKHQYNTYNGPIEPIGIVSVVAVILLLGLWATIVRKEK